jgi:hypothetical protein
MEQPWKPALPILGIFRRPEGEFNLTCFRSDEGVKAAASAAQALKRSAATAAWATGTCGSGIWVATASCARDLVSGLVSVTHPERHLPGPDITTLEHWGPALLASDLEPVFGRDSRRPA